MGGWNRASRRGQVGGGMSREGEGWRRRSERGVDGINGSDKWYGELGDVTLKRMGPQGPENIVLNVP